MAISAEGFRNEICTFYVTPETKAGDVVSIKDNYTFGECNAEEIFTGLCTSTDGKLGTIQFNGFMKLKYSGTAPAVGKNILAADGKGGVKVATRGSVVSTLAVNEADSTVEIIK